MATGLRRLLPRSAPFFDQFREAAANAAASAAALADLVERYEDVERKAQRLRALEHVGDEITHRVFTSLNLAFQVPIDRDLIGALAHALDDFVDAVEEVGRRLWLYHVEQPTAIAREFARLIRAQADTLAAAVPLLASDRGDAAVLRHAVEVHRLENEGDALFDRALTGVYAEARDVPTFVAATRWRDLYGLFEEALDRGEDVADALAAIVGQRQ